MSDEVPLAEQISAVEAQALGVRDAIERAAAGKIRRPPEWLETKRRRLEALRASYASLRQREAAIHHIEQLLLICPGGTTKDAAKAFLEGKKGLV